jgi:hypothetical protein
VIFINGQILYFQLKGSQLFAKLRTSLTMTFIVNILILVCCSGNAFAASDLKVDSFVCSSPFKSVLNVECEFTDRQISMSFDFIKPMNGAMVKLNFKPFNKILKTFQILDQI